MSGLVEALASRKTARIGLAVAAVLAAAILAFGLDFVFASTRDDTDEALAQLAALHSEAAARPMAEAEFRAALNRARDAPGLIHAGSAALAQAQLQSEFKKIAGAAGADVRSAEIMTATKAGGFDTISVQFELTVAASRLADLAYAVETHGPYLFISEAHISAANNLSANGTIRDPRLDITWTIVGYRWNGAYHSVN